jgi:hypothetical protein
MACLQSFHNCNKSECYKISNLKSTDYISGFSTSKLDQYNRNGAKLCEYYGCRKHTKLHFCFRGIFCAMHACKLYQIRSEKYISENLPNEISWRYQEMLARKEFDTNHVYYINNLSKTFKQIQET